MPYVLAGRLCGNIRSLRNDGESESGTGAAASVTGRDRIVCLWSLRGGCAADDSRGRVQRQSLRQSPCRHRKAGRSSAGAAPVRQIGRDSGASGIDGGAHAVAQPGGGDIVNCDIQRHAAIATVIAGRHRIGCLCCNRRRVPLMTPVVGLRDSPAGNAGVTE